MGGKLPPLSFAWAVGDEAAAGLAGQKSRMVNDLGGDTDAGEYRQDRI